jgi:hypothetical protein
MSLLPPPENVEYPSRKAFIDAMQQHAQDNGYAVSTQRSSTKDGTIYLGCDRSGVYRHRYGLINNTRLRNTGSQLTGCPFSVRGKLMDMGVWTVKVCNGDHNHGSSTTVAHPIQCRMTSAIISEVNQLSATGSAPREIIIAIRQTFGYLLTNPDLYNTRAQLRLENLAGHNPTESLLVILKDSDYIFDYKTDANGHVTHLFFAHTKSVTLLKQFPHVFLLDCTYKTNKFKLPLLNIVGTICLNSSFYASFCFLAQEEEGDYV